MVIAVAVLAVIVIGEVIVYTSDYTDYSAEATLEDGVLDYTVSADGSKVYSVVVSDDGGYPALRTLYLYHDGTYPSDYETVDADVGAPSIDQRYYLEQVAELLGYRSSVETAFVDAEGLADVMAGEAAGVGVVVISGTLPATVYTGSEGDPIFAWLSAGGSLYWAGNSIGSSYSTHDELVPVEGYERLFFGAECLYEGDDNKAYDEVPNGYTQALSLTNNDIRYGVSTSLLPSDRASLAVGFESDGYASVALVQYGDGMVCVLGGQPSKFQRYDMAQVIAAGLSPYSELLEVAEGSAGGSDSGSIDGIPGTGVSVYIYLGGYYPVFGKLFRF